MGLIGLIKFGIRRSFEVAVILLLIAFLPRVPPEGSFSKSYKLAPFRPFEGPLTLNEKLNGMEIWHKGDLLGPECFAVYKGEVYTSLHGGDVVKLVGNHITPVVKFGKPCKGFYEEHICGRPLGLEFDKNGALYVADAYYGVFKVDIVSGNKQKIVSFGEVIEGKNVTLPNSLTVASNGDFYWTDSSAEFNLQDGVFDMLSDGSGRLIHYDVKTKKNKVLIDGLHFANGIWLPEEENFIVVSESGRGRLLRYYLKGPKKGTHDIFLDGLPGLPDNLKSDGHGGILVPLVITADDEHPCAMEMLGPFPRLRKLIARLMGLSQYVFKLAERIYPNEYSQRAIHMIGHFTSLTFLNPVRFTLLHVSKEGEILDSLHSFNKKLKAFSEAFIFRDTLYLGSPWNDYIARIPLSKIGWEHLKEEPRTIPTTVTPKSTATTTTPTTSSTTTTTPKPTTTTTTPKPTTTTTTPKPTTTTTTPKPTTTTTTPKPTTTTATPKPTTATTPRPTDTTTPKPTATATPKPTSPKPAATSSSPTTAQSRTVKEEHPQAVPVKEAPKSNTN